MSTIFVQIASYRDPELPKTLEGCLEQARYPDRLRFGVCWQHDESEIEAMTPFLDRDGFRIHPVDHRESMGCCWARNQVNRMYGGEDFTLQIDAHMRFAPYWDVILLDMLKATGDGRPVLTTYPPAYTSGPGGDQLQIGVGVQQLILDRLNRDLTTTLKCDLVPDTSKPGVSRFVAAGFFFTLGRFCIDVPYDPHLYFNGEETNLAVRAYTHGYNFFYPNRNVVWHLYAHGARKHWSDHPDVQDQVHPEAIDRLRELLVGDSKMLRPYGPGAERTVADYERFAGLDFSERAARTDDPDAGTVYDRTIELPLDRIPDREDYEFIVFCLLDDQEQEIYRNDIYDPDVLAKRRDTIHVTAELDSEPHGYMLWPKSRHQGFESRVVIDL